jgi:hypothetical protein
LHNRILITTFAVPIPSKRKSREATRAPLAWLRAVSKLVYLFIN